MFDDTKAQVEVEAWRECVCKEIEAITGESVNESKHNALVKAIEYWGVTLVDFRGGDASLINEKEAAYHKVATVQPVWYLPRFESGAGTITDNN